MSNKDPERQSGEMSSAGNRPSELLSLLVIMLVVIASIASATAAAYVLHDLLTSVAVFIFTLLVLAVIVPYLGLAVGLVNDAMWFKTYVLVLKRIPGLDAVIDSFVRVTRKK